MSGSRQASASATLSADQLARGLGVDPDELKEFIAFKKTRQLPAVPVHSVPAPTLSQRRAIPATTAAGAIAPPQVSCLLVINQQERLRLARQAVECFLLQTWPNKQLIIVNGVPDLNGVRQTVTNRVHPWIVEEHVPAGMTVGTMRNMALEFASGEWIMQWDDDDWSHPLRIAYQMGHRRDDLSIPVLLRFQIRFDSDNGTAYIHDDPAGIPGTILFCRRATTLKYADQTGGEDTLLRVDNWGSSRVVVANEGQFPASSMSIAFCHKLNVMPRTVFMNGRDTPEYRGKWSMPLPDMDYLRLVLERYGMRADSASASAVAPTTLSPGLENCK